MPSAFTLKLAVVVVLIFFTIQCLAIQCHHCTSFKDEACGDPFTQDFNESSTVVDCASLKDGRNYTFCRKTVQTAILRPDMETTRIIRACGFIEDPKLALREGDNPNDLRCYRRVGTYGVELIYCACYADGCNAGNSITAGMSLMFVSFLTLAMSRCFY